MNTDKTRRPSRSEQADSILDEAERKQEELRAQGQIRPSKMQQTLGTASLIRSEVAALPIKQTTTVRLSDLVVREGFDREESEYQTAEFKEFVAEIKRDRGNQQPIDVREVFIPGEGTRYEILAGYRRTRALREALVDEALVSVRDIRDDRHADLIHENENRHRINKSPLSRGRQYVAMLPRYNNTNRQLAEHLALHEGDVSRMIRLVQNAPRGMWDRVEDPSAITHAASKVLVKAFDIPAFQKAIAHVEAITSAKLLELARRHTKKPDTQAKAKQEIVIKQRGDRKLVQLPPGISAEDEAKIVAMIRAHFAK